MAGAIEDVVVLELSTGVAGAYCARLLSDLGAQVVKVEPDGGEALRSEPPLVDGESAFFAWLNAGKYSAVLRLEDARLDPLLQRADIIIHSELGDSADMLEARITRLNPAAVILSVSPYGRSGERSGWQTTEFTEYATGGYHYYGGDPEREPIALHGHQASFHAGLHSAFGVLAALWHARGTGQGQCVEVSHQEAMLTDQAWLTTIWTHTGEVQRRTGSMFVECADGYVYLFHLVPHPNLFILMERFDLLADETLHEPLNWVERFDEVLEAFSAWAITRKKQEIYHAAQELRVAVSPVNTMADLVASPQLKAREWFGSVKVADETFIAPGFPFHPQETPCAVQFPAPSLGEHTDAVLDPAFEWANADVATETSPGPHPAGAGPLHGVRVIEVTAHWAGPAAGRHLADAGAEVIKIELETKPATRALIYVGGDLWPEHYHRSGYFHEHNRNKKAVCLDLSKPTGKAVFLDLVKTADVVLENNSVRVMAQLGLAWDTLREVNPRLVMCSLSGYGHSGPERNYSAYGSNIETASGLASVLGYGPGENFGTGTFYADPVTGTHASVAVMAALHHVRRTGQGQWIDVALLEAVLPFFAQPLLHFTTTGEVPEPRGNASLTMAPQGVYASAGTDCWLALSCRDDEDFRSLCQVIGAPDLASESTGLEWRRANSDRINEAIAAWSIERDHLAASEALQAAGVPASPVLANWEIASDNHLHDRGFFVPVRNPKAGTHFFPGFVWRFEKTPSRIWRPGPLFAEHNHEIFAGLLGLSDGEIQRLYDEGATADVPVYADGPSL